MAVRFASEMKYRPRPYPRCPHPVSGASQYGAGPKCKDSVDHIVWTALFVVIDAAVAAWTLTGTADRVQVDSGIE